MRSVLIRRFEISGQFTLLFNGLFWTVLATTGILSGSASRANVEPAHLSIGVHFAFGFVLAVLLSAYILFAKSTFNECPLRFSEPIARFLLDSNVWSVIRARYSIDRRSRAAFLPRSLQRRPAHCLRRSYFSEYSFARFRLCFVRTAPTAGGTEQCLPIGVMRPFRRFRSCLSAACCLLHIFRWRFCRDRAQSHVVVSGKSFFGKTRSMSPLG